MNPLQKPGEDPAVLPWPGLALIDHFLPSSLHPAPATLWGLALQGAFWANPLQKRKPPSWVLFFSTSHAVAPALLSPFLGGGWREEPLDRAAEERRILFSRWCKEDEAV